MFRRSPYPSPASRPQYAQGRAPRTAAALAASVAAAASLMALAGRAAAVEAGGSAALVSDYVWRGTTQSQGDPAVQAGLRLSGASGWYGSVWGSSVEFAPETKASSEFDFVVGWSGSLAPDWALDVNLTHYRYPSAAVDLNWTELIGTLTWKQNCWLQAGHSNDALATGESGTYAQVGAKFPLGERFRIEAAAGRYWLEDAYGDDYAHAQLGAVWAFKAPASNRNVELRVTAHQTGSAARRLFPGLAGSRIEAALQASF